MNNWLVRLGRWRRLGLVAAMLALVIGPIAFWIDQQGDAVERAEAWRSYCYTMIDNPAAFKRCGQDGFEPFNVAFWPSVIETAWGIALVIAVLAALIEGVGWLARWIMAGKKM